MTVINTATPPRRRSDSHKTLIGATSFRPELGDAIAIWPGEWAVSAKLTLEDGRVLQTPPMAITVTG